LFFVHREPRWLGLPLRYSLAPRLQGRDERSSLLKGGVSGPRSGNGGDGVGAVPCPSPEIRVAREFRHLPV